MIRRFLKNNILPILDSIKDMHLQALLHQCDDSFINLLAECQEAAVAVGETIESVLPERTDLVELLEQYCEYIYNAAGNNDVKSSIGLCEDCIKRIATEISAMEIQYLIVFMPYKASMWDSLESIYLAAESDPQCEVIVMPIPYYNYDKTENKSELCYEGEQFPEEIQITDYRCCNIEDMHPNVVYIHNPYDNSNYVTSVAPRFYSEKIKAYADVLVYVPYYITGGFIGEDHKYKPVYKHMDYMIAQSEHFKDGMKDLPWYNKVIALGSPKADRLIKMCNDRVEVPTAWKKKLEGKKSIMLNTSINRFLYDRDIMIDKLKFVLGEFKKRDDVVLVWRPHPLMRSTLSSIHPELVEAYDELLEYFTKNDIGILDTTPDITQTIAIVDAYMGEESSSVINLFGIAGKPLFILNNLITDTIEVGGEGGYSLHDLCKVDGMWYVPYMSEIYRLPDKGGMPDWEHLEHLTTMPDVTKWNPSTISIAANNGKIYPAPIIARYYSEIDASTGEVNILSEEYSEEVLYMRKAVAYGDSVFYLPSRSGAIEEYNTDERKFCSYKAPVNDMKYGLLWKYEEIYDCTTDHNLLWCTATYANRLLCFDMNDGSYTINEIGDAGNGYAGITLGVDGCIYISEIHRGDIYKYIPWESRYEYYPMPGDLKIWIMYPDRYLAFSSLHSLDKYIVAIPAFGKQIMRFNIETHEFTRLAPDLLEDADIVRNGYHPSRYQSIGQSWKIDDNRFMVTRSYDGAVLLVDVHSGEYTVQELVYSKEEYERFLGDDDGFEQVDPNRGFFCSERDIYQIQDFIDRLVSGKLDILKERQKKALANMAVNLDGSCGTRVHEFIMAELETRLR